MKWVVMTNDKVGTWFRSRGLQRTSSVRAPSAGLWPFLNMPLKILFSCQAAEKQSVKMILFVHLLVTALLTGWWIIHWNLIWSLPWHRCFQTESHYLLSALSATPYPTTRHILLVHRIERKVIVKVTTDGDAVTSHLCRCLFLFDESTEQTTFLLMGENKVI